MLQHAFIEGVVLTRRNANPTFLKCRDWLRMLRGACAKMGCTPLSPWWRRVYTDADISWHQLTSNIIKWYQVTSLVTHLVWFRLVNWLVNWLVLVHRRLRQQARKQPNGNVLGWRDFMFERKALGKLSVAFICLAKPWEGRSLVVKITCKST